MSASCWSGWQQRCFTYVSVTPQRGECGLAKINLHQDDWHAIADRGPYIDAMQPEVMTGDPLSLAALLAIDFAHRPRAILSTSMTLLPGLRAALARRFDCPVLDLYSLNEAGPIAVFDPALRRPCAAAAADGGRDRECVWRSAARGRARRDRADRRFQLLPAIAALPHRRPCIAAASRRRMGAGRPGRPRPGALSHGQRFVDQQHRRHPRAETVRLAAIRAAAARRRNVRVRRVRLPQCRSRRREVGAPRTARRRCSVQIEVHPEPCDKVVQYRSELVDGAVG